MKVFVCSANVFSRDTTFTYFTHDNAGESRFQFFKEVVAFHPIGKLLAAQDWDVSKAGGHFALALFTFLYVDIIDCTVRSLKRAVYL